MVKRSSLNEGVLNVVMKAIALANGNPDETRVALSRVAEGTTLGWALARLNPTRRNTIARRLNESLESSEVDRNLVVTLTDHMRPIGFLISRQHLTKILTGEHREIVKEAAASVYEDEGLMDVLYDSRVFATGYNRDFYISEQARMQRQELYKLEFIGGRIKEGDAVLPPEGIHGISQESSFPLRLIERR